MHWINFWFLIHFENVWYYSNVIFVDPNLTICWTTLVKFHFLNLYFPQTVVISYLLIDQLGMPGLCAVAVFTLFIPIVFVTGRMIAIFQKKGLVSWRRNGLSENRKSNKDRCLVLGCTGEMSKNGDVVWHYFPIGDRISHFHDFVSILAVNPHIRQYWI